MKQILLTMFLTALVIYGVWVFVVEGESASSVPSEITTESSMIDSPTTETASDVATTEFGVVFPMQINGIPVQASIADSVAERQQGLSNTVELPANTVKLFVFEESDQHGFWMKDMNYAIDIMWVDASGAIVHIESDVPPDSYPQVFSPSVPARYVIETNAGFAEANSLQVDDMVTLPAGIE